MRFITYLPLCFAVFVIPTEGGYTARTERILKVITHTAATKVFVKKR